MTTMTMSKALNEALRDSMTQDPSVVLMGQDVGKLGGVFRVTAGLRDDFGDRRVVNTPLGEAGIVGTAIGLAMRGYRPIVEIQFDGFVFPAVNQIVTQLAKYRHRSSGDISMPIVVRIPIGGGIGAVEHHSESPETYFTHTPGLRVVTCSGPQDAYSLLRASVECDDPVVFLEPKRGYWFKADVDTSVTVPLDRAVVARSGQDITIVAYGPTMDTALDAAEEMKEEGIDAEVIDLRSLAPLDMTTVFESVRRTGRLIVVHEASLSHGMGAEIAARAQEQLFYNLEAPVLRVTGFDTPYPPNRIEEQWLPSVDRVMTAVRESMEY
jgi:2-oxoisovalerate dehydrogenase E1 component beta subunit